MSIYEKIQKIRDFITSEKKQNLLHETNEKTHSELCISLNTLEDTDLAIKAYSSFYKEKEEGRIYLIIYGILQVLFVQQDAVSSICKVLEIENTIDTTDATYIRDIRNSAVGHPASRGSKETASSYSIIRTTLSVKEFELLEDLGNTCRGSSINISKLISMQINYINQILIVIIEELEKESKTL